MVLYMNLQWLHLSLKSKKHCLRPSQFALLNLLLSPSYLKKKKNSCLVHLPYKPTIAHMELKLVKAISTHYCLWAVCNASGTLSNLLVIIDQSEWMLFIDFTFVKVQSPIVNRDARIFLNKFWVMQKPLYMSASFLQLSINMHFS